MLDLNDARAAESDEAAVAAIDWIKHDARKIIVALEKLDAHKDDGREI